MGSVLRQNVRRRMMMRYAPFISALGDKHGESRWGLNWFAIDHPSKSVKASDHNCVIVDYDCAPFINCILVTGSFGGREISHNRLSPLGNNRANSAEKNRIGPIVLGDAFRIVGAISSRPPIDCHIGIICWARRGYSGQPQYQCYESELGNSPHSITSSASSNTGCGMVRLSALAVFRLITNSNLVGCSTGSSAGFSPLTTRPVYMPVS